MSAEWLPLAYVLAHWRPGSFDRTWEQEFADRSSPERIAEMWSGFTDHLVPGVLRGGWEVVRPVTLGWDGGEWRGQVWDGRVWAGHARLFLAHRAGRVTVLADVVPQGERRPWPGSHCAPEAGRA